MALMFCLGAVAGVIAHWMYFGHTMRDLLHVARDMHASALYIYEVAEADEQLHSSNRDVAIYALDRAVRRLNGFQHPSIVGCRDTAITLGKFNIWLAHYHGERGDETRRAKHLDKALEAYKSAGWQLANIDDMAQAAPYIRAGKMADAVAKYGKPIPSCLVPR